MEEKKDFAHTAVGLAQEWCFLLARRKFGQSADYELDMVPQFEQLLDYWNLKPEAIRAAMKAKRDRAEYFWQFKQRLVGDGKKPRGRIVENNHVPTKPPSAEEQEKIRNLLAEHRVNFGRMPK